MNTENIILIRSTKCDENKRCVEKLTKLESDALTASKNGMNVYDKYRSQLYAEAYKHAIEAIKCSIY